jgi:hypothetical protein
MPSATRASSNKLKLAATTGVSNVLTDHNNTTPNSKRRPPKCALMQLPAICKRASNVRAEIVFNHEKRVQMKRMSSEYDSKTP